MALLSKGDNFLTRCGLLGVWAVFLIGGLSAASTLWPNAVRHVRANWWQSVPCEVFAERKVSSGKHGTAPQFAIRYAFLDGAYETVSGKAPFFWQSGVCWRAALDLLAGGSELSWVWRPSEFSADLWGCLRGSSARSWVL